MASQGIWIWGASGHAASVAEAVTAAGHRIFGFIVDGPDPRTEFLGAPVHEGTTRAMRGTSPSIVIGIGDNWTRERVVSRLRTLHADAQFPSVVHPSAIVAGTARIAQGAVVLQGAVLGAGCTIGSFCIVNSAASVDHDSTLEEYSSVAPGVVTGGSVVIGRRSAIGIGAVVRHGRSVGPDSVVGAASYVHEDLPAGVVAYGTPAIVRRLRSPNDTYLN